VFISEHQRDGVPNHENRRDGVPNHENRRDGILNRELRPEFDAFHYDSGDGEDKDDSAVVAEMVGRALTVWQEVNTVGRSEMHGNRWQSKLHLLSPRIHFACLIYMAS
jgi:hypothetical protein